MSSLYFSNLQSPRRAAVSTVAACLVLLAYIGFLVISNHRNQIALKDAAINRFRLDLEKRAASLGYFFSERKFDLSTLASSREIAAYFTNKSLGMSEQYGLKVSLFVIGEVLKKTIAYKMIEGDAFYDRFLMLDGAGRRLVDSAPQRSDTIPLSLDVPSQSKLSDPTVIVHREDSGSKILLLVPCFCKDRFQGELVAWVNLSTLSKHFVQMSPKSWLEDFHLTTSDGLLIDSATEKSSLLAEELTPIQIANLPLDGVAQFTLHRATDAPREMLATRFPIDGTPLNLVAWVSAESVFGPREPLRLLVGMGILSLLIVLGTGLLVKSSTHNLILRARYEESERQQDLLASKNRQLEEEIHKREAVESKLEEERTIRMRSDRLRSLGEMAAGIAHELNQPLTGVRGLAEFMLLMTKDKDNIALDVIEKHLNTVVEQADRMVHIINHVRLFARESGKAEKARVDLSDLARSGLGFLEAQFKSHGLLIECELLQRPLVVYVNPFSVEEVLFNLLNNARHAVEERAQEGEIGYAAHIHVRTYHSGGNGEDRACLEVEDNGMGIPESNMDRIFDPFFTTRAPDRGTGLGLSICKSIVEEYGGSIHFISQEGEGSVFTISFPECDAADCDDHQQGSYHEDLNSR